MMSGTDNSISGSLGDGGAVPEAVDIEPDLCESKYSSPETLTKREKELDDKSLSLQSLKRDLDDKESRLGRWETVLCDREETCEGRERSLKRRKEETLQNLKKKEEETEQQLKAREIETEQQLERMKEEMEQLLKRREDVVTQREDLITMLEMEWRAHGKGLRWQELLREFWPQCNKLGITFWAAEKGHLELMRFLLSECGTPVDMKDKFGSTILHHAAEKGQLKMVKYLVSESGAEIDCKNNIGSSPLHRAAEKGHLDMVRLLVSECGASVDAKDDGGSTPLHRAAEKGHLEVVRYLGSECEGAVNCKDKATLNIFQCPWEQHAACLPEIEKSYRETALYHHTKTK